MSDNKKYYYLKFKENYFEQDQIKVIESMPNGCEYSLIILKLYLKSLKWEGQLRINEIIPYHEDKIDLLAGVIGHKPETVKYTIQIAKELGMIKIIQTGEIFITDIQDFIGHSSTEADRKRAYRKRLKSCNRNKLSKLDNKGTFLDKRPPELELELEKEIEIDNKKDKNTLSKQQLKKEELNQEVEKLYQLYPGRDSIQKYSTGKCKKNKEQLKKLLKNKSYEHIRRVILEYLEERKKAKLSIKTFSNFLNEFPDVEEYDIENMSVEEIEKLVEEGKI
jgi:predicted phage replisome organizer